MRQPYQREEKEELIEYEQDDLDPSFYNSAMINIDNFQNDEENDKNEHNSDSLFDEIEEYEKNNNNVREQR